jgi:hypothetical protein
MRRASSKTRNVRTSAVASGAENAVVFGPEE